MRLAVSGIAIDPKGTRLFDDVIYIEETDTGYLLLVSVPDIQKLCEGLLTKKELSLCCGELRSSYTIQLRLSPVFHIMEVDFLASSCTNEQELTWIEFDEAYTCSYHPYHQISQLYYRVAFGLEHGTSSEVLQFQGAAAVINWIICSINAAVDEWASYHKTKLNQHHQLRLNGEVRRQTSITSPLRVAKHRNNLLQLIAFAQRSVGDTSLAFLERHGAHMLGDTLGQGASRYANKSYQSIAHTLFNPTCSKKPNIQLHQKLVRNAKRFNDNKCREILVAAEKLGLIGLRLHTKAHSKAYISNIEVNYDDLVFCSSTTQRSKELAVQTVCTNVFIKLLEPTLS